MNRKATLTVIILLITAVLMTACGSSANQAVGGASLDPTGAESSNGESSSTTAADKDVTITFYNYLLGNAAIGKGAQTLIDEFEASHPHIHIEPVSVPVTELIGRVQADVATGTPPDIAQLAFKAMDIVVNGFGATALEDIVSEEEWKQNFEGFSPKGLDLGKYDGKTYGLPFTFSTPVLFYNADLLRQAGLDAENPPATWEEVTKAALQIKEKTGIEGFHYGGLSPSSGDWIIQSLIASNGGSVISSDRKTLQFDSEQSIQAIQMWRGLVDSGAHDKLNDNEAIEAMTQGKLGMFVYTSAVQSTLLKGAEAGGWELQAAELPAFQGKETKPMNSGSALFILSQDEEKKKAAWEFMKFVTSERGYSIITSEIGYLPLRTSILDDPKHLKDWAAKNPLIQPNIRQLERLTPAVAFPGQNFGQISTILMNAIQKSVMTNADVAKVMQAAQKEAQQLMP
jgi:multiple sugar transport system substrate-binding protein